jgi:hypothetical protein
VSWIEFIFWINFDELWNRELCEEILGRFESDLTIFNAIDRIKFFNSMNESCECDNEILFTFLWIDLKSIFSMPFEMILNIISNESLQLKDYESLYEMISSTQTEDSRIFTFWVCSIWIFINKIDWNHSLK